MEDKARGDYMNLENELDALFSDLSENLSGPVPPAMSTCIASLIAGIQKEINFVRQKQQRGGISRLAQATEDGDEVLECYHRMRVLFERLTLNTNVNVWKTVDEQATDTRLKALPYSPAAKYNSAESESLRCAGCSPNTRAQVLQQLQDWAHDGTSHKIYWLNGMAGTGKTTIAYSLCEYLESAGKLGASFFCSRQLPTCRDVNRILPSISYQLSMFSRPFRHAISRILEESPEAHNQPVAQQFEKLIAAPLKHVGHTLPAGLVVVLDALDECEGNGGVDRILDALFSHVSDLPVKFFITSRPDPKIIDRMQSERGERVRTGLHLHELERSVVQQDIRTYLTTKLAHLNLSATNLEQLVERSGVLFIYAATVVRYIGHDNFARSNKRLKLVLDVSSANSDQEIDSLYTAILEAAFEDNALEQSEKDEMNLVLRTVLCAQEPLTVDVIVGLLDLDDTESMHAALRPLLSVLQVSDADGLVTTLHESFPNYMFDRARSNKFYCDTGEHHARLTQLCFGQIRIPNPPFNICNLASSYLFDREVDDLEYRVARAIPQCLFYACRYWEAHLELARPYQDPAGDLWDFLSMRLLLWMEIMNLKRSIYNGALMLYKLTRWLEGVSCPEQVRYLAEDARKFVTAFSSSAVSESTPHIYISALPFWPEHRPVSRQYIGRMAGLVKPTGTAMTLRERAPLAVCDAKTLVNCIAYSPNGAYIVSGSEEGFICIWDAYTGQLLGQLLGGHTKTVESIAYSPNGRHIAAGFGDNTICVWDPLTWRMEGRPLNSHTGPVKSVAYSPDGAHVASGSTDKTIRIWDIHTGKLVGQPLQGHTNVVSSIAWSPNSARIASGSWDGTIRIWDVYTGQVIGCPLDGHRAVVTSVAYSSDGEYIVSGSMDCTIRIWNARTGQAIGHAIVGHRRAVTSLAYSHDGAHVVSGSSDRTVRVWDAHTRQPVGQPIEGHTKPIMLVAYSPNSNYIISCAWDRTIRIWEADTGQLPSQPLKGHNFCINSVAYSPDGERIVSGSGDGSICVWDANAKRMVGSPPEGHIGSVTSVAYSLDGAAILSGSGDNTICIWDAHTGQKLTEPLEAHTFAVSSVACSPNGVHFVSASHDETIRVWDAHTWETVGPPIEGHTGWVTSVTYSWDGKRIFTGSDDHTIRIWDAYTGLPLRPPLTGHTDGVTSIACSPDGERFASGSNDCSIRIWNARTGQAVGPPLEGHSAPVRSVKYSPDSSYIISGSDDKTVRIWDVHTGRVVGQPLEGHQSVVSSVAYSPDGEYIISGSWDYAIRIWRVNPNRASKGPLGSS